MEEIFAEPQIFHELITAKSRQHELEEELAKMTQIQADCDAMHR